ncbi:MAG: tRNA (adenosine(37)-N6)-threonylcarbamoyltransferase complex dimerization subunit type 1 TsaB [Ahrensia sp.]|nr:tRNA (adenosine(37)-N6)-threonylcarbamoyltransferase complex dimerization subunit type 1 TsaB [Ahrensia sp.]
MKLLGIDTAGNLCALCVWDGSTNRCIASRSLPLDRGQAEHFFPLLEETLNAANIEMSAIDKVAVNIGPGSFTGIRVGVAAARGFGVALNIPVVGVTAFEVISAEVQKAKKVIGPYAVALNGGRGQAFVQRYAQNGLANGMPEIVMLENIADQIYAPDVNSFFGNAAHLVDAKRALISDDLAKAGIETIAALGAVSTIKASPLYMRAADAKIQEGFALPRLETNLP